MKDEIKEILEALRDSIDDTGTDKVNFINWVDKIEDYITNLKKEVRINNDLIPYLKNKGKSLKKQITNLQEENERLSVELNKNMIERNNYLSRNEKAREYINTHYLNANEPELLNILNGGDDNE